jgi:putative spermidine/putrescine transport system substrate-binding protein
MRALTRMLLGAVSFMLAVGAAHAVEPVNAPAFNIKSSVDLKALAVGNFEAVLLPAAKAQGPIVFYDFTESFTPLFAENIIPKFEQKYGIKVTYRQVNGEQAIQQLIAAKQAGQPSPVDVFFMPNGQVRLGVEAGIIANLPLNTMLPSAQDLDQPASTVARGFQHGGVVVPFHRNQTAIGYDTRFLSADKAPKSLAELLNYAKANPKKLAITNPTRGGSGQGIIETAILALSSKDCLTRMYDYTITAADAKAWAEGPCMTPTIDYFKAMKPNVEFTNGNTDTLTLLANGQVHVGTTWEDQTLDFIGRGLLPPTVRSLLLTDGQVGDGDGVMIPAGSQKVEAALLFVDFLLSDETQLFKLGLNGSRSARTKLDIAKALKPEVVERLVPGDQYPSLSRPRIVGVISSEASKRFVTEILQTP